MGGVDFGVVEGESTVANRYRWDLECVYDRKSGRSV
jgi:hypothetical protein